MRKVIWGIWLILSILIASIFGYKMFAARDKTQFLIGETTSGHHQIELACDTCHTSAFGGTEVLQNACINCHQEELDEAHDSHPRKKFTDPRNADLLEILDARYCISCHVEHQKDDTHPMGVTLPEDYCYQCHQTVTEDRESHAGLEFTTCASSGCHNFHDNRALYEDFLVDNANKPWLKEVAQLLPINSIDILATINDSPMSEDVIAAFAHHKVEHPDILTQVAQDAHGKAGLDCTSCHISQSNSLQDAKPEWIESPGLEQCQSCHSKEVEGFVSGKHGMRQSPKLSQSLTPMTPSMSEMKFHSEAMHVEQSCSTCHSAHDFDIQEAAVDSCLSCHADEHSQSFSDSPHGKLWERERSGVVEEGAGVSCATCHMPRISEKVSGKVSVRAEHNQNMNLRPNEKMIRSVCLTCHSLEFSLDSLADPKLIENNFNGQPEVHIQSIDWSLRRARPE